jgi:serine/threonine protein kinase
MILGTAAYMSPEQARGKVVDKRADIWAFGVVLYELLAGKRLFQGEDLTETLASVVKEDPKLAETPPRVRRLLRKCLAKDPKNRLRDIGDVWALIEDAFGPTPSRSKFARTAGALAAAALDVAAIRRRGADNGPAPSARSDPAMRPNGSRHRCCFGAKGRERWSSGGKA